MDFVILLFGFGMVACLILDVVFYLLSKKKMVKGHLTT